MTRKAARLATVGPLAYCGPMLALALLLAAAPAAQAEPLLAAYTGCLEVETLKLDDGRSDAATVGRAVADQCREVERRAAVALSGDNAFENREAVVLEIMRDSAARATEAVLRVRAARAR